MTDELVKRLRIGWHDDDTPIWVSDTMVEAADRIKQLTAERDGLLRCVTDNHVALCRAEKAEADFARQVQRTDEQREAYEQALSVMEAERDRLREALGAFVAHYPKGINPDLDAACFAARAALKGESRE